MRVTPFLSPFLFPPPPPPPIRVLPSLFLFEPPPSPPPTRGLGAKTRDVAQKVGHAPPDRCFGRIRKTHCRRLGAEPGDETGGGLGGVEEGELQTRKNSTVTATNILIILIIHSTSKTSY